MANALTMVDQQFETKKNWRATTYTAVVIGALLLFFIVWRWPLQSFASPIPEEGIEVNLGNSEQGLGEDQPFLPGKPAPSDAQAYIPPPKVEPVKEEDVKDIATDDKHEDAPEIKKPPVVKPKPEATKVPEKEIVKNVPVKNPAPVSNPTPPAPKPKAVFKGTNGTGTGGNEADNYKKGGNQGIAGGKGDQGSPGGDPDSKNYTGNKGSGGIRIMKGNRSFIGKLPDLTGEFDESATIYADIEVSPSGNGQFVRVTRGSTSTSKQYVDLIVQKLKAIKFNTSSEQSIVNIQFNFRITK